MIKPAMLKKGDKIAVVSLSWGGLGDKELIHKYRIAESRLRNDFGLQVIAMPNALKGSEYIYANPQARANDLMEAFADTSVKGIFCAIGGDDTIRLLPYIDYDIIRRNPKIFMGYSDTTVNHFMMNKAGLVSFYGPSVMCEFGEYVNMFEYTKLAVNNILFTDCKGTEIKPSPYWSNDFIPWCEENMNKAKRILPEIHGYEVLQGSGTVTGQLSGGCIDVFPMVIGTQIWPTQAEWEGKILLIETSEDKPKPELLLWYLRNLGAQGILDVIKAIIVGKPMDETYYDEYKEIYRKVLKEFDREALPVMYNINIGHASPTGVLPLGTDVTIDFDSKKIFLAESPTQC